MVREMEGVANKWGMGGRVAWTGLERSYLMLQSAGDLFAKDDDRVYAVYFLRREFYTGER